MQLAIQLLQLANYYYACQLKYLTQLRLVLVIILQVLGVSQLTSYSQPANLHTTMYSQLIYQLARVDYAMNIIAASYISSQLLHVDYRNSRLCLPCKTRIKCAAIQQYNYLYILATCICCVHLAFICMQFKRTRCIAKYNSH